jgi:hypothetical protein
MFLLDYLASLGEPGGEVLKQSLTLHFVKLVFFIFKTLQASLRPGNKKPFTAKR